MPITRAAALAMSEGAEQPVRTSRFREHTNTSNSIRPPPEELWKDLEIESLIECYNEENARPPIERKTSANSTSSNGSGYAASSGFGTVTSVAGPGVLTKQQSAANAQQEGTYARFQRAVASMLGSVLGKRKASSTDAEREKEKGERERAHKQHIMEERKRAADAAYYEAKESGLLPTPKVFVRPAMAARSRSRNNSMPAPPLNIFRLTTAVAHASTPRRTPSLHHTPSKKDLQKQQKLSKRVSDLEFKLASARKDLHSILHTDVPPVPPLKSLERNQQPTPDHSQSENEAIPQIDSPVPEPPRSIGRIVKKRKATLHDDDSDYKPTAPTTDSEADIDPLSDNPFSASEGENETPGQQRMIKRVRSSASRRNLKRQSTRLQKRLSRASPKRGEKEIRIVPDGEDVPAVPVIPVEMEGLGQRVRIGDDGFGGLGHEIF